LDQLSKSWVVERAVQLRRDPIRFFDILEGPKALLEITYVTNPGAAWSMFSDYPEALTALACIALVAMFLFRRYLELEKLPQQFIFVAIAGGTSGNLVDRIFREPAEVVDFVDVYLPVINYDYPVFNVADSAIFLGAISCIFLAIKDALHSKVKESVA
jgi:signal peptidase II